MKRLFLILLITAAGLSHIDCAGNRRTGRLEFVSLDEELKLGQEFALQATQRLPLIRNYEINRFLNKLAAEIGAQSDWSGLTYSVHLINQNDISHFSLPGGHVFIYRGALETAATAAQVAAIIAHEIAHLAARDGVERMAQKYGYALAAQRVVGDNPEIAGQIIANLYSRDTILDYPERAEREADRKSIIYAWKADYDPAGLLLFLLKIRQMERAAPSRFTLLNRTHPSALSRYRFINKEIESLELKSSVRGDLPEFSLVRETLEKIPY